MEEQQRYEVAEIPTITKDIIDQYLYGSGTKLTEPQKAMFLQVAQINGLNPFKREVYAIPYGDRFNIITGYEVYLKRAERSGKLAGWKAEVKGDGNNLVGICTIWRKDWQQPISIEAWYSEYNQGNKMWKDKPRTMIRKVAIAQAFRMAFPEELGGMPYTADEMPVDVTPVDDAPRLEKVSDKVLTAIKFIRDNGLELEKAEELMGEPITENNLPKLKKVFKTWKESQTKQDDDTISCPNNGERMPIPYCNTKCDTREGCPAFE